jgi:DNA-directed RNA polymerase specialized sigma24 family protein
MAPPKRPIDELLAKQDWGAVHAAVTEFAYSRTHSWDDAEELSQEAITRVLDPAYRAWDPEKEPSLVRHLGSIVNSLLANRRNTRSLSQQRAYAPDARVWATRVDPAPTPAHRLESKELAARAIELLRVRVAGDALVAALVELCLEAGTDKPAELAEATGRPVEEIYNAQRRLAAHMAAVRQEIEGDAP